MEGAEAYLLQPTQFSETTAERIDAGVRVILDAAFAQALNCLRANRKVLDECAAELLEKETLDEAQLTKLTRNLRSASSVVDQRHEAHVTQ